MEIIPTLYFPPVAVLTEDTDWTSPSKYTCVQLAWHTFVWYLPLHFQFLGEKVKSYPTTRQNPLLFEINRVKEDECVRVCVCVCVSEAQNCPSELNFCRPKLSIILL